MSVRTRASIYSPTYQASPCSKYNSQLPVFFVGYFTVLSVDTTFTCRAQGKPRPGQPCPGREHSIRFINLATLFKNRILIF